MRRHWLALWLVAIVAVPSLGAAKPTAGPNRRDLDAARALAIAGSQLYREGHYAKAIDRFLSAEAIHHAPPHVLFMARANAKLGRLLEARRLFVQLVADELAAKAPRAFREAQKTAEIELIELDKRIPSVAITLEGDRADDALVSVDGEVVGAEALAAPLPLDPGAHVIKARVPGLPEAVTEVTLRESGGLSSVSLTVGAAGSSAESHEQEFPEGDLPSDDAEADAGPSIAGPVVLMSVGAAGLVVGAITGGLTLADATELEEQCPGSICSDEHEHLMDSVNTLGTVSTVAFAVGGAALGGGLLWLLLQPPGDGADDETAVQVEPYGGPLGWGVRGRF